MAVYVFLHDGYADWELGYLLPELRSPTPAPSIPKRVRSVVTFGLTRAPVESLGGLRVTPQASLGDVASEMEALVLPGGTFWEGFKSADLDALVLRAAKDGLVGAICAATGYLGSLGLLDDVAHSSNSLAFLHARAPSYRGSGFFRPDLATRAGHLVTASGLGAVEFTYQLLLALEVYPPAVCEVWYRAFRHGEDPSAPKAGG